MIMTTVPLKCTCGKLRGEAIDVSASRGNHGRCTCIDCRAYIRYLGRKDILDEDGGIELFQFTPSQVRITTGSDQMRCVKLSEKGMNRWYTECCKTPIGNTMPWAKLPFVGMPTVFMDFQALGKTKNEILGPRTMTGNEHQALRPQPKTSVMTQSKVAMKFLKMFAVGFLKGQAQPSPYFSPGGIIPVKPKVLTSDERAKFAD